MFRVITHIYRLTPATPAASPPSTNNILDTVPDHTVIVVASAPAPAAGG